MKEDDICCNPIFLGAAIHCYINDEIHKLSEITNILFKGNDIYIQTKNNLYKTLFKDEKSKKVFLEQTKICGF